MKKLTVYILSIIVLFGLVCCDGKKQKNQVVLDEESKKNSTELNSIQNRRNEKDSIEMLKHQQYLQAIEASEKCKVETLQFIRENVDDLTDNQVLNYLESFNKICALNIEYSEGSNSILFLLLQKQPEQVLRVLSNNNTISLETIKKNLENPIYDTIDLNSIYRIVDAVKGYQEIKKSVLASLKIAINSFN